MLKMNAQVISIVGAVVAAGFLIVAAFLLADYTKESFPTQEAVPEQFRAPDIQSLPDELWVSNTNPKEKILLQSDNIFREYTSETQTGYGKWEALFFFDDENGIGKLVFTYAPEGVAQKNYTIIDATTRTLTLLNVATNEETLYILTEPAEH